MREYKVDVTENTKLQLWRVGWPYETFSFAAALLAGETELFLLQWKNTKLILGITWIIPANLTPW